MKNKQELIKNGIIVIVVIIVIIYYFISHKSESVDLDYTNILASNINESNIEEQSKLESVIKVYITGNVNNPGVIQLNEGDRIEDAIKAAGGLTSNANLEMVNLAYSLNDGEKIYIPSINENVNVEIITNDNGDGIIKSSINTGSNVKVNINTATIDELTSLNGVGESLAQKIIDYRETNGKYKSIEDLKNVSGIGDKKYEGIEKYVCVK